MSSRFQRIGIIGKLNESEAFESVSLVVEHLLKAGVNVQVSRDLPCPASPARQATGDDAELAAESDLLIAVGGDGTVLHAGRLASQQGVPVLGINRGRLGFLADIRPEDIASSLDAILGGDYASERRMLLRAEIQAANGDIRSSGLAVNDIVVKRTEPARMLEYSTTINGTYVNAHGGDGFIAATPTGSTAYALSVGGPIVEPGLDAIVMAPICPHTLADRPIVISGDSTVEVRLLHDAETLAEVSGDGAVIGEMNADECLRIVVADERIELLHPPGYDYYEILRDKLYWGRDTRQRTPRDA